MDIRRCLDKTFTLGQSLSWLWTVLVIVLLGAGQLCLPSALVRRSS